MEVLSNFEIPIPYLTSQEDSTTVAKSHRLYVSIRLYSKVFNMNELLEHALKTNGSCNLSTVEDGISAPSTDIIDFDSCYLFLKPEMIVSVDHIIHGIIRSVYNTLNNKTFTASFPAEVAYMIAGSKSVTQSIKQLCIDRLDVPSILPALVVQISKLEDSESLFKLIKGDLDTLDNLSNYSDQKEIIRDFKFTKEELALPGGLLNCVMCRIGTKCI